MKIVINNLIDNAIKYSERKPELIIELATSDRKFYIAFTDRGIGISRKDQKRIFDMQQADGSLDRSYEGAGLGLAIASEITKLMGGSISFTSEPGKGSTFMLEFSFRTV